MIEVSKSGDWQIMRPRLLDRIEELREQLERGGNADEDNKTRGEIAGLRWLIAQVEPPAPDAMPSSYTPRHGAP